MGRTIGGKELRVGRERGDAIAKEVLAYLVSYVGENGWAPSYREIVGATTLKSTSSVVGYLRKLESHGLIRYGNGPRKIFVTDYGQKEVNR